MNSDFWTSIGGLKRIAKSCLTLFCATLLLSCAGGSKGTGGDEIYGQIVSSLDGKPLSGISVTVASTGDKAVSAQNGEFYMATEIPGGTVTLVVDAEKFTSQVSVFEVPEGDASIRCIIEIDQGKQETKVRDSNVKKKDDKNNSPSKNNGSSSANKPEQTDPSGTDDPVTQPTPLPSLPSVETSPTPTPTLATPEPSGTPNFQPTPAPTNDNSDKGKGKDKDKGNSKDKRK